MRIVGFDPSLNNWGIASGTYDSQNRFVDITALEVIRPALPKGKTVRQNSKDLLAGNQLATAAIAHSKSAHAVFVEVPHGSQSARAMASYGICVGILASMRAFGIPFFELNALEVKMATVGSKTATKREMIDWAMASYPNAPWPTYAQHGEALVSEAKAEHMADACAVITAGMQLDSFKQLMLMRA